METGTLIGGIGAGLAILAFIDNRFIAGRTQEHRQTLVEQSLADCVKDVAKLDGLFEMKVRFDIWWKVFEAKALSALHHPEREYLDWFIDHYDELKPPELQEFAAALERLADDPATAPDEKFLALGLFIQVTAKLTIAEQLCATSPTH